MLGVALAYRMCVQRHAMVDLHGTLRPAHSSSTLPGHVAALQFHNIKSNLAVPPQKLQAAASGHVNASLYENDSFGVSLGLW